MYPSRRGPESHGKLSRRKKRRWSSFHPLLVNSGADIGADNVRRIFHQWLAAARAARHRRLLLQRREDEVKLATMEMAWDKWRDKFKDDQLRPIVSIALTSSVHFSDQNGQEYELLIRNQQNALRHVLDAWKAKTKVREKIFVVLSFRLMQKK